ncbi:Apulose-4-phosphate transketolase subunit A [subsurface metagenome]
MFSHPQELIKDLEEKARRFRVQVIKMIYKAQSGHPGGSLSCMDILTALYFHHLRINPQKPAWEDRDRFVLSKGHAAPVLYVVLAELGYFPKETLFTLRQLGSILQGHPDMRKTPGVEMSTGSLGNGLSVGIGMALGARLARKNYHVYALVGDGELDEGGIWEAAMAASKYKLDNLTAICDFNQVQLDGPIEEIMPLDPLPEKWEAFNWNVIEMDGHNMGEILDALDKAKQVRGRPTVIVAHTVKGKGVSFMEGKFQWHGNAPNEEEYKIALKELGG